MRFQQPNTFSNWHRIELNSQFVHTVAGRSLSPRLGLCMLVDTESLPFCECHADNLIHIEVTIGGKSANKANVLFEFCPLRIFLIETLIASIWNGIIAVSYTHLRAH